MFVGRKSELKKLEALYGVLLPRGGPFRVVMLSKL